MPHAGAFDGWNRGDVDAWLELAHPEVEFYSEVAGRMEGAETVSRGLDGAAPVLGRLARGLESMTIEVAEARDLGDTVLVLGRMRARGEGSGVDLEQPVAYVFEFEGRLGAKGTCVPGSAAGARRAVDHSSRTRKANSVSHLVKSGSSGGPIR